MLNLTQKGVEVFMKKAKSDTLDTFWNNYDLVIWKKDDKGYSSIKGMFRKENWGIAENISVNNEGIWKLPKRYVRFFR